MGPSAEKVFKKKPAYIKAKEKTAHMVKKVDNAKKSLKQAQKAEEAHKADIQELETELRSVNRRKEEYEDQVREESQSSGTGSNLVLEDEEDRTSLDPTQSNVPEKVLFNDPFSWSSLNTEEVY